MAHLKMKSLNPEDGYFASDWISKQEELTILNAVDKGKTKVSLAKEYGCSTATISSIVAEQRFKKANKALAKNMAARELQCASYLWQKGFSIARRPK